MNFQADATESLNSTSLGRIAYQAARRTLHLTRKIRHPRIPTSLGILRVTFRGKHLTILHRRTYADKTAIKQCFEQEQYDMPGRDHGVLVERFYQEILAIGKQPLIVDCGANIGASVLWFATRYPHAHVLAIEPAPDNFDLLQRNCAGLDVDLRKAGIGADNGVSHISDVGFGTMAYRTIATEQGPEVNMVSMASLLASKPNAAFVPFILKIDVEGGEEELFSGDCSDINRFPLIIMEPHDWLLPGQGSSLPFFRFHTASGREFCMKDENVASINFKEISQPHASHT